MTPEQNRFVDMLEEAGFIPNLLTVPNTNGQEWTEVSIEANFRGNQMTLTFNPDGKLLDVDTG
jgi:hypothetical protein